MSQQEPIGPGNVPQPDAPTPQLPQDEPNPYPVTDPVPPDTEPAPVEDPPPPFPEPIPDQPAVF